MRKTSEKVECFNNPIRKSIANAVHRGYSGQVREFLIGRDSREQCPVEVKHDVDGLGRARMDATDGGQCGDPEMAKHGAHSGLIGQLHGEIEKRTRLKIDGLDLGDERYLASVMMDGMCWRTGVLRIAVVLSSVVSGAAFAMSCHSVVSAPAPLFLAETQIDEFLKSPLPSDLYVLPPQKGEVTRRWRAAQRENAPIRTENKKRGAVAYGEYYFLIVGPNEQIIFSTTDYIEWPEEYYVGVRSSYASVFKLWLRSERGQLARAKDYPIHAIGKVQLSEKRNGAIQIHSFSVEPYWFDPDAPVQSEHYVRSTFMRSLGKNCFYKAPPERIPWDRRVAPTLAPEKRQSLVEMGYSDDEIRRVAYFPSLVDAAIKRKSYQVTWPAYISSFDLDGYDLPPRITRLLSAGGGWSSESPLMSMGIVDVQSPDWVEVYRGIQLGVEDSEVFDPNFNFDRGDIDYVSPSAEWVDTYYMQRKRNNTMVTYRLPAFLLSFEKAYQGTGSVYHHALKPSHLRRYGVDDLSAFVVEVE